MTSFVEFTYGKRLFGTYLYINNLKLDSINHTITEVSALRPEGVEGLKMPYFDFSICYTYRAGRDEPNAKNGRLI